MPKYTIGYTVERWYEVTVEAPSGREAMDMFWKDEIDFQTNPYRLIGEQLQDYITIKDKETV